MFELTNEQRKCFGLDAVQPDWRRIEAKASPYDDYKTYLYLDGNCVVKGVMIGSKRYCEFGLNEVLSDDGVYLLPKTAKGKPVKLSASTIAKRKRVGMCLHYHRDYLTLYNANTDRAYFTNSYVNLQLRELPDFIRWVVQWCDETTAEDIMDVTAFANEKRKRVKYKEGDVFRYKIDRRHYGYGRILLDYNLMRKNKEPFWDILMGTPLVCSAYHIVTTRKDVSVDELSALRSLPSCFVADNNIFYGENKIIGNIPVTEYEDYPIMYGGSIAAGDKAVCWQQGKVYRVIAQAKQLDNRFRNNGVRFRLNVDAEVLRKCIAAGNSNPYWLEYWQWGLTEQDLRNPKYRKELANIKKQFDL